jgi:lysophospholipase L1-like esterase
LNRFFSLFDKKIAVPVYVFIVIPLLAYWGWETYWATQVGYLFIKWHTHLMPFVYIGFIGIYLLKILYQKYQSQKLKYIFLLSASLLLSFFIAETFFVFTGVNKVYIEKISGVYVSSYLSIDKNHYHVWPPGKPHKIIKPYYCFWYPTNSLGFSDEEWRKNKTPGEKRILALGDSFTEGDGAPYDSSYVASLRRLLISHGDSSYYVLNGGISGSDPFNNYINLKGLLLPYKPDFIIQSWSSSDMEELLMRGGLERFQKDGTVKFMTAPWWEPVYAVSYVSRVFFNLAGYDQVLRKKGPMSATEKERIDQSVKDLFTQYKALCLQNNIKMVIVLHPEQGEVETNKYDYDLGLVIHYLTSDLQIRVVDLLPAYRSYIKNNHREPAAYYWKYDGHHNSRGYAMMAETTLDEIRSNLSDTMPTRSQ